LLPKVSGSCLYRRFEINVVVAQLLFSLVTRVDRRTRKVKLPPKATPGPALVTTAARDWLGPLRLCVEKSFFFLAHGRGNLADALDSGVTAITQHRRREYRFVLQTRWLNSANRIDRRPQLFGVVDLNRTVCGEIRKSFHGGRDALTAASCSARNFGCEVRR
jgi:hypothetical protein